jgi:S1-C subfamily serine protease
MNTLRPNDFILSAALFLCLSACTARNLSDGTIARLDRSSASRKAPSLAAWRAQNDPELQMLKRVAARTPILLAGQSQVVVFPTKSYPVIFLTSGPKKDTARPSTYGSAVPVSRDGYFLTAAHCLGDPHLQLAVVTKSHRVVKTPARVVWTGHPTGPDLAIIHAPIEQPIEPFILADLGKLRRGDSVALSGWSSWPLRAMAAGRIVRVSPPRLEPSGITWRSIRHDAPFAVGDSGGPLVTSDGRLAGINVQMRYGPFATFRALTGVGDSRRHPLPGATGESFAPDADWLNRTIVVDRSAQR